MNLFFYPLTAILALFLGHFVDSQKTQTNSNSISIPFKISWQSPSLHNDTSQDDGQERASLWGGGQNDTIQSYTPRDFIFNSCELQKYKAPQVLLEIFPYYQAGFDDEDRPIWVGEFGKYNLRRISGGSKELQEAFDGYSNDITYNMIKSLFLGQKPGRPVFEFVFIIDFEGLQTDQVTIGNLQLLIKLARRYAKMIDEYAKEVVVINVNFLAEQVTNLFRPVFGRLFEKVKIYGTNKEKWLSYLRQNYPKESLPEWYGGSKNFQPVGIYGR